ncbi:nose resistant to fluoxetine protein 6-like isoform X3 [Xenia sp. Carnegie-2017]|uniref:nose resistant to fluoxetine protein 6-like isoform X3 n=1 Tax=Xenia sp. Carnegie-2017 TaxID=2897299 RepID=UPI001F044E16|nr:nose resistant to fluoxetine protein 6-like isoform X3 [Xenia sp. Carnegie-2017]
MANHTCFYTLIIVFLCYARASADDTITDENERLTNHLLIQQNDISQYLRTAYRSFLLNRINKTAFNETKLSISPKCWKDFFDNFIQYMDAVGKLRSGILRGNFVWLGSYSECQALPSARYCLSKIDIHISMEEISFGLGTCLPDACSVKDTNNIFRAVFYEARKYTGDRINIESSMCHERPTYSTGSKVTIVFLGVLLLSCLLGTFIELVMEELKSRKTMELSCLSSDRVSLDHYKIGENFGSKDQKLNEDDVQNVSMNGESPLLSSTTFYTPPIHHIINIILAFLRDFLLCFSLIRNTEKIFNTNVPPIAIKCINGIRVISITWVILGHLFMVFALNPLSDNRAGVIEDSQRLSAMPVINGYYSVDSFFFLSGLLVAYTCFRKLQKSGGITKFNWFLFYFHRFWRLTPTLMAVILISIQLKRFLAEGPLWYTQYEDKLCKEYWWTNLLYINNFYPTKIEDECVAVTWYLANDMQFFIITPPLLILMYKFGWLGIIGPGGLMALSTAAIAFVIGYYDLDPVMSLRIGEAAHMSPEMKKKSEEFNSYVYIKPWCRAQPYLVGFVLGYVLYKSCHRYYNKQRNPRLFWLITLLGWAIAFTVGMLLVYGPHKSIVIGSKEWPLAGRVAFGMFERLLWALALAWVTYSCHYNSGCLVGRFLSAKFWIPLSRLTFNVYLLHIFVLLVMFIGAQGQIHYDFFNVSYYFISAIVLSYAAAYALAVTVELPCNNIEDLIIRKIRAAYTNGLLADEHIASVLTHCKISNITFRFFTWK